MSKLVAKILLSVLIFPAATLVLFVSVVLQLGWRRDGEPALFSSALLSCGFMIAYWVLLWRRSVKWTGRRVRMTCWALAASAVVGAALRYAVNWTLDGNNGWFAGMLGSLSGTILWIIGTIWIWRETPAERAERITRAGADTLVCPACGYNLTGLHEARCPECGASYTLNDLYGSQPSRAVSEVV